MTKAIASLFINKYKPNKNGECPISIRISYNRKVKYFPTGSMMFPEDFSRVKANRSNSSKRRLSKDQLLYAAFDELEGLLSLASKHIKEIETKTGIFSFSLFERRFNPNAGAIDEIKTGYQNYIQKLRSDGKIGTALIYECSLNSIQAFKKNMKYVDVTPEILKAYEKKMLAEGNSKSTIGIYVRCLRAIFNQSDISKEIYPFGEKRGLYSIPTSKNIKKALTLDEVAKIFRYESIPGSREEMCRDLWIFSYLSNGMNIKDVCRLKRKDINGDVLRFVRAKTKNTDKTETEIVVSLKAESKAIISKWGQPSLNPESFIFPFLPENVTPERERAIIQQLVKTINKYMKRIADKLGIDKQMTTYFARHSFASVLKRANVNIEFIREALGHGDTKTTQNYLDGFEAEAIHSTTNVLTAFN